MERRRIIPLETEREYAPTERQELSEILGGFACMQTCDRPTCFTDKHHMIYSGANAEPLTEAETLLKTHPDFQARICRDKHERVHRTWDRSEPVSNEFAVGYLLASPHGLKANQKRRLKELKK